MKRTVLVLLTMVFLALNFIPVNINPVLPYDGKETFDPSLSNLNTIQKLTAYIDNTAKDQGIKQGSLEYAMLTESVIKKRFYHSFSHYSLQKNWIAAVSEKLFGYGLASVVDPEDIIKYPMGACSQQSIVMVELLRNKGYDYRSVGFPHHYALEFGIGHQWYYFDPNMEPNIPNKSRIQSAWNGDPQILMGYYDKTRFNDLQWKLGNEKVKYGKVNTAIAKDASIFQSITGFMSKIAWVLPLILLLYPVRNSLKARLYKILFYTPPETIRDIISMELR